MSKEPTKMGTGTPIGAEAEPGATSNPDGHRVDATGGVEGGVYPPGSPDPQKVDFDLDSEVKTQLDAAGSYRPKLPPSEPERKAAAAATASASKTTEVPAKTEKK